MEIGIALLWTAFILTALIGWGCLVEQLIFAGRGLNQWSFQAVWGIGLAVLVGGAANLASVCSSMLSYAFLTLGGVLWYFRKFRNKPAALSIQALDSPGWRGDWFSICIAALLAVWAAGEVLSWTWYVEPNFADDLHGYFVIAERMAQSGSAGPDPFNTRLHVNSLGGLTFLQSLSLSMLSIRYINLVDAGMGLIVLLGLIWQAGRRVHSRGNILVLMFLAAAVPLPHVNITANRLAICLLLGLEETIGTLDSTGPKNGTEVPSWRRIVLIALVLSAACSLKSTLLPTAAFSLAAYYALRAFSTRQWSVTLLEAVCVALVCIAILLPWMIAMYKSGGTLLYPVFGIGSSDPKSRDASWTQYAVGSTWAVHRHLWGGILAALSNPQLVALVVVAALWLGSRPWRLMESQAAMAFGAGAIGGVFVLAYMCYRYGPDCVKRYAFPSAFAGIFSIMLAGWSSLPGFWTARRLNVYRALPPLLAIGLIAASCCESWPEFGFWHRLNKVAAAYSSTAGNLDGMDAERAEKLKQAQFTIEPGKTLLAYLSWVQLLDFKRNQVYVMDVPGSFSPRPGMPIGKGGGELADYLEKSGVDYVMYSFADKGVFAPPRELSAQLARHGGAELLLLAALIKRFNQDLVEIPARRKVIYSDDYCWVADLRRR